MLHVSKSTAATATALLVALIVPGNARAEGGFFDHLFEPGFLRLEEVIGMQVRSPKGELLGEIKSLLYDRRTGKLEHIQLENARYPVSALVTADAPGQVIVDDSLGSSAGATALLPQTPAPLLRATRDDRLVVDLRDGRVRPAD